MLSPLFRAMRTMGPLGMKKWLCSSLHWNLLSGFSPRTCNQNQLSVWEPTALWVPLSILNCTSLPQAPCFTAHRLIVSYSLPFLFSFSCLIFYMPVYIKVSTAGYSFRPVIKPQKLLNHMCGFVRAEIFQDRSFQVWVDAACIYVKFSGATEWFEISVSCPSGPSTISSNEEQRVERGFKVLSFRDPHLQMQKSIWHVLLVVAHPYATWIIPLAGLSLLSGSSFLSWAFQNLTPNRSPYKFGDVICWSNFLLSNYIKTYLLKFNS